MDPDMAAIPLLSTSWGITIPPEDSLTQDKRGVYISISGGIGREGLHASFTSSLLLVPRLKCRVKLALKSLKDPPHLEEQKNSPDPNTVQFRKRARGFMDGDI